MRVNLSTIPVIDIMFGFHAYYIHYADFREDSDVGSVS